MEFLAIILLIACAIYLKRLGAENAKQKKSDTYQETYEETRKRLQQLNSRSIQGTKPVVQLESKPELKPEPKPELTPEPKPEPKPAAQWKGQGSHPCWTDGKGRYYLYENDGLCCKVSETKPVETPESKAPVPREGQECHEKTDELMTEYKGEVVRQGYCGNRHEHEGGKNLQWELYDNNVLRIWGSGNMFAVPEREEDYGSFGESVDYYSSPWEAGAWTDSPIEEVWIEDGVTSIGDYAFGRNGSVSDGWAVSGNHFPNLRAVHIPASVTSIGYKAFAECPKLVIHAPAGSYAVEFAKEHRITFVAD